MFTAGFAGDHAIRAVWDDVICFRIQLFCSTVYTYLCQSTEAWFSTAPFVWQSCSVFAWEVQDLDFREMTSGIIRVFCNLWFDSGYMLASVLRLGRISHIFFVWWTPGDDFMFVSVFSAELGLTMDTCSASVYGAF